MNRNLSIDNRLNEIYLQENIANVLSRITNTSQGDKLQRALKSKNIKNIDNALKFVPSIKTNTLVSFARKKLKGYDRKYSMLRRKYNNIISDEEIQLMAAATTATENLNDTIKTVEDIDIEIPEIEMEELKLDKLLSGAAGKNIKIATISALLWIIFSSLGKWVASANFGAILLKIASLVGGFGLAALAVGIVLFVMAIAVKIYNKTKGEAYQKAQQDVAKDYYMET